MNQIVVKNPWHKPGQNKEYFDYSDRPHQEYRGYDLYTVIEGKPGACQIDIVFDGECISQMAGMNGAKAFIDARIDARIEE